MVEEGESGFDDVFTLFTAMLPFCLFRLTLDILLKVMCYFFDSATFVTLQLFILLFRFAINSSFSIVADDPFR